MACSGIVAHGVDLVEIARIEDMLVRHGPRFRTRCFTPIEQSYAEAGRRWRAERYAARFACKEAVLKALGTGLRSGISWQEISVVNEPSGRPTVRLSGRCAELAAALGVTGWMVSLSHARHRGVSADAIDGFAIASVIACGPMPGHDVEPAAASSS